MSPLKAELLHIAKWEEYDKGIKEKRYPFSIRFNMLDLQEDIQRRKDLITFLEELKKDHGEKWSEDMHKTNQEIIDLCHKNLKILLKKASNL